MNKNNKRNYWKWIASVALILVIAGALVSFTQISGQNENQVNSGDVVAAFIGDLSSSATASGIVEAQRDASLSFANSGKVAQVWVTVGDSVKAGDPLAQLDTAALERAVSSAQQTLIIQETNLATLLEPAAQADIAAAKASVASAQANLEDVLDGPSADEIAGAEADVRAANADISSASATLSSSRGDASSTEVRAAELQLELAQKTATEAAQQHSTILVTEPNKYLGANSLAEMEEGARNRAVQANADLAAAEENLDNVLHGDANNIASSQATVSTAVANRDAAQAQLDMLLAGPTEAEITAAEATLAQAQFNLESLLDGPSDVQIKSAEVTVEQARVAHQQAENNLAKALLTAPFTGTITQVDVAVGEMASGPVVTLVDSGSLAVVLDVDEVDLAELSVEQPAIITLETWPTVEIPSEVTTIAPMAGNSASALVTYEVYLTLDETDLPVRMGMTANADLVTAQTEDVLLVPNTAVAIDRAAGTYSVNLVTEDNNGQTISTVVPVTVGLNDSQYTQITSGLETGDQLLVNVTVPTATAEEDGGFFSGPPEGAEGFRGQ